VNDTPTTLRFCRAQHDDGSDKWYRMCLSLARQARGLPGRYASAWEAWEAADRKHPVDSAQVDWSMVPRGAPLFYRGGEYGHVATFIGVTKCGPLCWSNDAGGHGKVSMVNPLWFEPHWQHYLVGYTADLNGYDLPLRIPDPPTVSLKVVSEAARQDSARQQGGQTPGAGPSVIIIERALAHLGYLSWSLVDGSYGTSTMAAYRHWQETLGFSGKDADGVPGKATLDRLGAKFNFKVVA